MDLVILLQKMLLSNSSIIELDDDNLVEKVRFLYENVEDIEEITKLNILFEDMEWVYGPYFRTNTSDTKFGGIYNKSKYK